MAPEAGGPDRPVPVLPEEAFFLGQYAELQLTITARRDGSIEKVVISKPSQTKLYDEYTRQWVEQRWRMPTAEPGEPDERRFIAPIVFPKAKWPAGGHFSPPHYPSCLLRDRIGGLVLLDIYVKESGEIESARPVLSSGNKHLDDYTAKWVLHEWKYPPGEKRWYRCPFAYLIAK